MHVCAFYWDHMWERGDASLKQLCKRGNNSALHKRLLSHCYLWQLWPNISGIRLLLTQKSDVPKRKQPQIYTFIHLRTVCHCQTPQEGRQWSSDNVHLTQVDLFQKIPPGLVLVSLLWLQHIDVLWLDIPDSCGRLLYPSVMHKDILEEKTF